MLIGETIIRLVHFLHSDLKRLNIQGPDSCCVATWPLDLFCFTFRDYTFLFVGG